tara:strand:- start:697 stop:1296 length:600 start_codon:yes stop_codon:yes gene_type:complete
MELFNNNEFSQLLFNVYPIGKDVDLIAHFKRMQLLKSFTVYKGSMRNEVIRYIIYMYDEHSPLRDMFPDLNKRKRESAHLAGLSGDVRIKKILSMKDDSVLNMIDDFVRFQNNRIWALIVSNEETFYEYQSSLIRTVSADKDMDILRALQIKSKLMDDCDTINARLESYYSKLYGDNKELLELLSKRRGVTPEMMAKKV